MNVSTTFNFLYITANNSSAEYSGLLTKKKKKKKKFSGGLRAGLAQFLVGPWKKFYLRPTSAITVNNIYTIVCALLLTDLQ